MAVTQNILDGLNSLQQNCNNGCQKDRQFHLDAEATSAVLADMLRRGCGFGDPADDNIIALSTLLTEMAQYHGCMANRPPIVVEDCHCADVDLDAIADDFAANNTNAALSAVVNLELLRLQDKITDLEQQVEVRCSLETPP